MQDVVRKGRFQGRLESNPQHKPEWRSPPWISAVVPDNVVSDMLLEDRNLRSFSEGFENVHEVLRDKSWMDGVAVLGDFRIRLDGFWHAFGDSLYRHLLQRSDDVATEAIILNQVG